MRVCVCVRMRVCRAQFFFLEIGISFGQRVRVSIFFLFLLAQVF